LKPKKRLSLLFLSGLLLGRFLLCCHEFIFLVHQVLDLDFLILAHEHLWSIVDKIFPPKNNFLQIPKKKKLFKKK